MKKRSVSDAFLFFQVFIFAAAVPLILRLKLSRLKSLLNPSVHSFPDQNRVEQITAYVETAIRKGPFVRPGCLTRGVTRYYFLRRDGIDVSLCFGMGRVNGDFVGHCWLVRDGLPFMETHDPRPRYAEMYRIPDTAASYRLIPSGKTELEHPGL
jgi:hypothetical protein